MLKLITSLCVILLSSGLAAAQTNPRRAEKGRLPPRVVAEAGTASKQDAAERVLEKFVEAQGDAAAVAAVKSYVMRGIVDALELNAHGTVEEYAKLPDKRLVVVNLPGGVGQVLQGRDERGRWAQTPYASALELGNNDPSDIGKKREGGRRLRIRDRFSRLVLKGKTTLGGREIEVVEGTPVGGNPVVMYFDTQTGLLFRVDYVNRGENKYRLPKSILFEDFAKVKGVVFPNVIREVFDDYTLLIRYYEVKFNVQIEDALFERPKGPDGGELRR